MQEAEKLYMFVCEDLLLSAMEVLLHSLNWAWRRRLPVRRPKRWRAARRRRLRPTPAGQGKRARAGSSSPSSERGREEGRAAAPRRAWACEAKEAGAAAGTEQGGSNSPFSLT